ncbi:MAG: cation-translocating P-type ATPase [Chthonomonadales bacterium]
MKQGTLRLPNPFAGHEGCRVCLPRLVDQVGTIQGVQSVHFAGNNNDADLVVEFDSSIVTSQSLVDQFTNFTTNIQTGIRHETILIGNMDCPDCAKGLDKAVQKLDGVLWSGASFAGARMQVEFDESRTSLSSIVQAVEERGLRPHWPNDTRVNTELSLSSFKALDSEQARTVQTIGSLALMGLGTLPNISQGLSITCSAIAIIVGGRLTFRSAWFAAKSRTLDMNVLMSIAIVGAVLLGDWSEAASVVGLFSLGNLLQARAFARTRKGLSDLIALKPTTATIVDGLDGREVPIEEINVGDIVVIRPGERIPVDGIITKGQSTVDQSPITGESLAMNVSVGDSVFAGSLLGAGALYATATSRASDSTLSRIVHRVEQAREQRAPIQTTIERFAAWYTPTVLVLAVLTAILPPAYLTVTTGFHSAVWAAWLLKAISLLIIACPCALVIATPIALVTAIGAASKRGALVKDGASLEAMGRIQKLFLDKTGTITTGEFKVDHIIATPGFDEAEALRLAAIAETWSDHPLARSMVKSVFVEHRSGDPLASEIEVTPGHGISAMINGRRVVVGSESFLRSKSVTMRRDMDSGTVAILHVGLDGAHALTVYLTDTLRLEASEAIVELANLGVTVELLTGDNAEAAQIAARQAGITSIHAQLLPEQKLEFIQNASSTYVVGMVGDGYNDAPALAAASVGIAMAVMGNETAIETADIAILRTDLRLLPRLVRLSRATTSIINQNIAAAILTKTILATSAILVGIPLWLAVFGDVGVTLLVTINSLRLVRK